MLPSQTIVDVGQNEMTERSNPRFGIRGESDREELSGILTAVRTESEKQPDRSLREFVRALGKAPSV